MLYKLTEREKIYVEDRAKIDTVQDYLVKLGIKPSMHLWEISILSLNNAFVRPTKNHEQSRQKIGIFFRKQIISKI